MNDRVNVIKTETGTWRNQFIGMDGHWAQYEETYTRTPSTPPRPAPQKIVIDMAKVEEARKAADALWNTGADGEV